MKCPNSPLLLSCEYEEYHNRLLCCSVHILNGAFNELLRSLPIIGNWVDPYVCPDFKPKDGE